MKLSEYIICLIICLIWLYAMEAGHKKVHNNQIKIEVINGK